MIRMNDTEYMSMKQIAEKLNVSKQRVYRCIKANCISEAHHEVVKGNTVLMYDKAAVERISKLLGVSDEVYHEAVNEAVEAHHETVNDTVEVHHEAVNEALLKQLEIKDQQIKELNERLAEAHKSLDQEQQLHLLSKQRILELESKSEEPGTPDDADQNVGSEDGFWKRIWKKYFNA